MKEQPVIIFITAASENEGKSIAKHLVEKKLAACTNIITGMRSLFFWDKQLCEENEVLLIIKSIQSESTRKTSKKETNKDDTKYHPGYFRC